MFDLNVPWPSASYTEPPSSTQISILLAVITTLYTLGYRDIAINFQPPENAKVPSGLTNPVLIEQLRRSKLHQFKDLRLYSRVTLLVSDPAQCQGLSKLQNIFDIIAIQPTTERALQTAVTNLDIDIISFNMSTRLPFFLKHKTIGAAVEKGIKFEICYSSAISGPAGHLLQSANEGMSVSGSSVIARRVFFSNVIQLIRALRSKGLIISSGASLALQTRSSSDILNLLGTVGLDLARARACMLDNPRKALLSGRLRIKSNKQTVIVGNEGPLHGNEQEDDKLKSNAAGYCRRIEETDTGRLLKRQRKGNEEGRSGRGGER